MTSVTGTWEDCRSGIMSDPDHYGMRDGDLQRAFDMGAALPQGAVVVELGVCNGRGSACYAYIATMRGGVYHGVDNFSLESNPEEWRARMDALGLRYTLHVSDTRTLAWNSLIDMLVIDAGHDEANVSVDCQRWLPWVRPGGYAIFDDWTDDGPPHAHWAIAYYGRQGMVGWKDLGYGQQARFWRRPTGDQGS